MASIVLDPGHGGVVPIGKSSALGYQPAGSLPEKAITLGLAQAVATRLGGDVALTRNGDQNLSLADRRAAAAGAAVFVLHETGHGLDYQGSGIVKRSTGPTFNTARRADLLTLSAYESQPDPAGQEETFAESCSRFYGGDPADAGTHPNLHTWWTGHPPGPYTDANG